MSQCPELVAQLQNIKELQDKLNHEIGEVVDSRNNNLEIKVNRLRSIYQTRKKTLELIDSLKWEVGWNHVKVKNYIKVDGVQTETEIKFDFFKILKETRKFYENHEIALTSDFETKAIEIWNENHEEIMKEVATYGYDHVLIIPNKLPHSEKLATLMTANYTRQLSTSLSSDIATRKNKRSKDNTFRLVLTHYVQDIREKPILNATIGKSPLQLAGLFGLHQNWDASEPDNKTKLAILAKAVKRLKGFLINMELEEVSFGGDGVDMNSTLRAEGLSLDEYLILQRQYFDNTGRHMDDLNDGAWTWLLDTCLFTKRQTAADCNPLTAAFTNHLYVYGMSLYSSAALLGCRFSRSFSHDVPKKENTNDKSDLTWNTIPWRPA